jgi:hypothetical protein
VTAQLYVGENWRSVLRKAWSVRLSALAVALMGLELAMPFVLPSVPPYLFVGLSMAASIGSIWARLLIQKNMQEAINDVNRTQ